MELQAEFPVTSSNKRNVEKLLSDNKTDDTAMSDQDEKQDHALVSFDPNPKHLHKIQLIIASKENMISETALKVLYRKREQLVCPDFCISNMSLIDDCRVEGLTNLLHTKGKVLPLWATKLSPELDVFIVAIMFQIQLFLIIKDFGITDLLYMWASCL